jgi:hypothetical protein
VAEVLAPWWFSFFYRGTEHRYSLDKIASARNEPAPTSKADAIKWRDRLRPEIRFGTFSELTPPAPAEPTRLTFGDVCEEYLKRYVHVPTPRDTAVEMFEIYIGVLRRAEIPADGDTTMKLEAKPIDAITRAALACTSTTCDGSSRVGCLNRQQTCTTCATSWGTRTSRRRARICGVHRFGWRGRSIDLTRSHRRLSSRLTRRIRTPFAQIRPYMKTAGLSGQP